MGLASKDANSVATIIGVLNSDGKTVIPVEADATSHGIMIDDDVTGSDNGPTVAIKDVNSVATNACGFLLRWNNPSPFIYHGCWRIINR